MKASAALLAATVIGAVLATSSGADAATTCAGNLIYKKDLIHNGKKLGELDVYWDAATKMNCAIFSHAGVTWGKNVKTAVNISRCPKAKHDGDDCTIYGKKNFRQDYAKYKFQAGPVKIKSPGCINAEGGIVWGRRHYMWWVETPNGRFKASFCGK